MLPNSWFMSLNKDELLSLIHIVDDVKRISVQEYFVTTAKGDQICISRDGPVWHVYRKDSNNAWELVATFFDSSSNATDELLEKYDSAWRQLAYL